MRGDGAYHSARNAPPHRQARAHVPPTNAVVKSFQRDFIRFAIDQGALRFGEFTLKSGRRSPYFFNTGAFDSGASLARLGECYAAAIVDTPSAMRAT